jgi:cytochrome c oxidase assembly protein subunit 15
VPLASVVCYAVLVVSGGAVRLTGSGLGCPDWPACYQHRLIAQLSFHPMVEDVNRLVTVGVTVVSGAAWVLALFRSPRRRDLTWLAGGLVGGVVAQIILGGLVVLFKLNPYLVALHFLLTVVILADAVVFFHRSRIDEAARSPSGVTPLVGRDLLLLSRLLLAALAIVTTVGTVVSGAGPHAGAPSTPADPIKRIPIALHSIAQLHADFALFLIGLTLASLFAFHQARCPDRVWRRARMMFELMVLQGALGYTQYFLHDNAVVVELHLAGVTALWVAMIFFHLSLHEHPLVVPAKADEALAPAPGPARPLAPVS